MGDCVVIYLDRPSIIGTTSFFVRDLYALLELLSVLVQLEIFIDIVVKTLIGKNDTHYWGNG